MAWWSCWLQTMYFIMPTLWIAVAKFCLYPTSTMTMQACACTLLRRLKLNFRLRAVYDVQKRYSAWHYMYAALWPLLCYSVFTVLYIFLRWIRSVSVFKQFWALSFTTIDFYLIVWIRLNHDFHAFIYTKDIKKCLESILILQVKMKLTKLTENHNILLERNQARAFCFCPTSKNLNIFSCRGKNNPSSIRFNQCTLIKITFHQSIYFTTIRNFFLFHLKNRLFLSEKLDLLSN